ncbi:PREDICTED: cation/H(+) antiporter 15-like [Nelumbo nucifera]|uniref:Cation/H(+) antiporter 15-like n=1 Tax=Nelumbo nucifera TaxID=4432 RepID=A0A1U8B9L4_NELNU|nr:PREDICTED: cation/H(+) antiporter 15-like [Nelumbo nucifera]
MTEIAETSVYGFGNGSWVQPEPMCQESYRIHSRGFWFGDNPLKCSLPFVLVQIALITSITNSIHFFLRPLRQSKFVSEIIGGIILGPSVLGRSKKFMETVFPMEEKMLMNILSSLASIYFFFLAGVKMDTNSIVRPSVKAFKIGFACFLIPFGIMMFVNLKIRKLFWELGPEHFLFSVSMLISTTPLPNLAYTMNEFNLLTSELGKLAMSSAVVGDVVVYYIVTLYHVFCQESFFDSLRFAASLIAVFGFLLLILRPAVLRINRRTPEGRSVDQVYVVALLVGVLVLVFLCDMVGIMPTHGALLLGLIVPEGSSLGVAIVEKFETMVELFLLPFLVIHCGISTDVFKIQSMSSFAEFLFFLFTGFVGKMMATISISVFCNFSLQNAWFLGLIMNIRGIIDIATFIRWKENTMVNEQAFTVLVLTAVLSTAVVTPLLTIFYKPPRYFAERIRGSIQDARPYSEFQILSCVHNDQDVHPMITLLEASHPNKDSPLSVYVLNLIELIGRSLAVVSGPSEQETATCHQPTGSKQHIEGAFRNYADNSDGLVNVQSFTVIAPYKNMHEDICSLAHQKSATLIIMPFHNNDAIMGGKVGALSSLNHNLIAVAPCSVGILVYRNHGVHHSSLHSDIYLNVALIFIGGADDREALAYVNRMSESPKLRITVIRFQLSHNINGDQDEKQLDDSIVREFRLKNMNNERVTYQEVEVEVEDIEKLLTAMSALQNDIGYDLLIVGRGDWTNGDGMDGREHPELASSSIQGLAIAKVQTSTMPIHSIEEEEIFGMVLDNLKILVLEDGKGITENENIEKNL